MDQEGLALPQTGVHEDVRPHRARDLRETGGLDDVHPARHRKHLRGGHRDPFRIPSPGEQRAHLVADAQSGHAGAQLRDAPRHLEPGVRGSVLRRRIETPALHDVRAVHRARHDVDQHLARLRRRIRNLRPLQDVGLARLADNDRLHTRHATGRDGPRHRVNVDLHAQGVVLVHG